MLEIHIFEYLSFNWK